MVESSPDLDQGSVIPDRKVIRDIREDPGEFYLEILNPGFPGGAIRAPLLA